MHKRSFLRENGRVLRLAAVLVPTALILTMLSQTAFAKTYVITDGDRVVTYTTFATDPAAVLGEAGVHLDADDTYITEGDSAITVCRGRNVTVSYHGERMNTVSGGETVGELLTRLNLEVGTADVLSHGLEEETFEGMELRVDQVVTRRETYAATVTHGTTYCADASLPEGTEEILVAGRDGELLCTADVTYVNGVETAREVRTQDVTIAPVEEIIGVGTGTAGQDGDPQGELVIGDGYIVLPTGEVLTYTDTATVRATAYTHTDAGCNMTTSTGTTVRVGTVAVDPRYIPYGTRMFIIASDGSFVYGVAEAEDCGGDIKGDRMDLYFPTYGECIQFGRRVCTIYFLG